MDAKMYLKIFIVGLSFALFTSSPSQAFCSADLEKTRTLIQGNRMNELFQRIEEAAGAGDPYAQMLLAEMYWEGRGAKRDISKSAYWTYEAAQNGVPVSQFKLGAMYDTGQGMEKDVQKALQWYLRAASTGHAMALYNLGSIYENGHGVDTNHELALKYYMLASGTEKGGIGKRAQAGMARLKNRLNEVSFVNAFGEAMLEQEVIKRARERFQRTIMNGKCIFQ